MPTHRINLHELAWNLASNIDNRMNNIRIHRHRLITILIIFLAPCILPALFLFPPPALLLLLGTLVLPRCCLSRKLIMVSSTGIIWHVLLVKELRKAKD